MKKKVLFVSLGIITIGTLAIFIQPSFRQLASSVLDITTPPTLLPRYFVSDDGKKMYTLTFNTDGTRKYSAEIPTGDSYETYYTDESGSHIMTHRWSPEFEFPPEAIAASSSKYGDGDFSTEYYSPKSVSIWAVWLKEADPQEFAAELRGLLPAKNPKNYPLIGVTIAKKRIEALKVCHDSTSKDVGYNNTIPNRREALAEAEGWRARDIENRAILEEKLENIRLKEIELSQLRNSDPAVAKKIITDLQAPLLAERDNQSRPTDISLPIPIPVRIKDINSKIYNNNLIINPKAIRPAAGANAVNQTQTQVDNAKKINNDTIAANQKIVTTNNSIAVGTGAKKGIEKQQAIIDNMTQKLGDTLTTTKRTQYTKSLNNALKEKYKLLQQNNNLIGGPSITVEGVIVVTEVLPENSENEKLNQKNIAIQAAFDGNIALLTERDVTLPARVKEINARLDSIAKWTPFEALNDQINGPKGWKAEIAKLPIKTLAEYDAKIAGYTRISSGSTPRPLGVIAIRQSELEKAIEECKNPEKTLLQLEKDLAYNQRIVDNTLDKLATMEAAKIGDIAIGGNGVVSTVVGFYQNIQDLLGSVKEDSFFDGLTDEEIESIISQLTDILSTGINFNNGQLLTPEQRNNGQQNLNSSKNKKDTKTTGVCCFCAYSDLTETATFKHSCSEKMAVLKCTKKRTGYYKDFDYNKYVTDFPNVCPAEKYSEVHFIVAEHGVEGGEEQTYCEILPEKILDSYKDNAGIIPTNLGVEHTECNALNNLSEAQKYAQNLRQTLVEKGYSDIEITIKGNQNNAILDQNGNHIPGCNPSEATIKVCSKYIEKQLSQCPDKGSACSLSDSNTTVECTENGTKTSRTCVATDPPLPNNFGIYQ